MTTELKAPPVPRSQMYNGSIMAVEWQNFFRQLFERVGGYEALSATEVTNRLNLFVEVVDIEDPAELSTLSAVVDSRLIVAYMGDKVTVYSFTPDAVTENKPYVVNGSTGSWLAVAGEYVYAGYTFSDVKGMTPGRIPYAGEDEKLDESAGILWDYTDDFLKLMSSTGKQIRLAYDSTNYADFLVDLSGELHITTTGAKIFIDNYTDNGFVKTINGTGEIEIDTTLYLPLDDYNIEDGTAQGQLAFWDATAGEWVHTETTELFWDDTNKRLGLNVVAPSEVLDIAGNVFLSADNDKILLGAGKDLSIYYNGTDGYIKTNEVAASDLRIITGAAKTVVYDTPVWEDLNFDPIRSGGPVATRPDEVTINNVFHKEFTSANNQLCGSGQEVPHNYKLGTVLNPHAHIFLKSGESAGTTGVTFTVYWELRQSTGTTSGSVTMSATSAQLGTTAGANTLFIYGNAFAGPTELGAQLSLTIARTAGDAGDIIVTTYGVHYEKDTPGSRTISSK